MEYVVFIGAVIAVLIIAKILAWPIKKIIKLVINILLGIGLLILFNYFGKNFNFTIQFNMITALLTGLFGIPGVILVILFKLIGF